jgi:redox-sensitive bicupin YhaK (pirin superfamily)
MNQIATKERKIKAVHKAVYEPIADLITFRAMPTEDFSMNQVDPFILLNHHGYQEYKPKNAGLPFGPHPHRGFETVTFILEGDLTHKDSSGSSSIIKAGGIQWMTAGSGLIHAEISSEEFKTNGGPLEMLQLWINLPARQKMVKPKYTGLQKEQIPVISLEQGKVTGQLTTGNWWGMEGAIQSITGVHLALFSFQPKGSFTIDIEEDQNILFYVIKGEVIVNSSPAMAHQIIEFSNEGQSLQVEATADSIVLVGYAKPFGEPFVAYGPFVMNTKEEIIQAYMDYEEGKFGDEQAFM